MPTFWSKLILRNRNYAMQDNLDKPQSSKKKKKSKKSTSSSNLNSSQDTNFYENDTSDEYMYGERDSPRTRNNTFDYEDVSGLLMPIDNRPVMSDFHNNNSSSNAGGMAHYMPKATQHLFLSSVLEGEKLDDYFHDCRLDNALKSFARFDSYEQPVLRAPDSPIGKENLYETIEPDLPSTPKPVYTSRKINKNSHKLDIRNWPTTPLVSGSNHCSASSSKQKVAMTTTVDSAGEEQEEEDNYIHLEEDIAGRSPGHSTSRSSYIDDSFDELPWCSGVDVLY